MGVDANQEDLLAMTALMDDDDFLDDFEEETPGVAQERLNQTVTVFPGQEEKMKPPRQPDSHIELVRQEEENARNLREGLPPLRLRSSPEESIPAESSRGC